MGDIGWEALRRRDLQSLSETTSPKALDEKRPMSKKHARSRAASRKAAAGLRAVQGLLAAAKAPRRMVG
jgi:hypothetical protein